MKKILLIDDDVDIVDLLESRLQKNNYEIIFANDGDSGLKKAMEQKPDLIILDIMMPTLGGETAKLLKSFEATKNIPILFFTSMGSYLPPGVDLNQINVDGQLYPSLPKPFDAAILLSTIKSLIGE